MAKTKTAAILAGVLGGALLLAADSNGAAITLAVDPTVGADFATIGAAAATEVAGNVYTINVAPGTYTNDFAVFNAATVVNATGVTDSTNQPPPNLKGVFSTTSPLTVNGLSFIGTPYLSDASPGSGISIANGSNSSAIREQSNGPNTLSLNGVTISGFQMGVLTSSNSGATYQDVVSITNSNFVNNGFPAQAGAPDSFGHAIYVGDAASLTVAGVMVCGQQIGHDIKSRAASTSVTGSTLYVGTNQGAPAGCVVGSASLAIDLPDGGIGQISSDTIIQGSANANGSLIRFGEEGLIAGQTQSLDVSNTKFTDVNPGVGNASIAIDIFANCAAPVTGTSTDTFTNTTPINPSTCFSGAGPSGVVNTAPTTPSTPSGPTPGVVAVSEPKSIFLLLTGLAGLFLLSYRRSKRWQ